MPHHSNNRLLSTVSAEDMADLQPHLRLVELEHGRVLAESRQRVHKVYFPHGGILSSVVELKTGWGIEVGMIGKDGVFGAAQAMDDRMSLNKIVVQVPGWASVIDAEVVKDVAASSPEFRGLLVKYDQFLSAHVHGACEDVRSGRHRTAAHPGVSRPNDGRATHERDGGCSPNAKRGPDHVSPRSYPHCEHGAHSEARLRMPRKRSRDCRRDARRWGRADTFPSYVRYGTAFRWRMIVASAHANEARAEVSAPIAALCFADC